MIALHADCHHPLSQVKYDNASSSTCDHPEQGTLCIAVVLHSPADRLVEKDVTETQLLSTGLEGAAVSDDRKAPQHVKKAQRKVELVEERTLICDVFAGYSEESGNARFDQTVMRDIVSFYKHGHFKHAHAASSRGEPVPIGKDEASAVPSTYDTERLVRLKSTQEARAREAEAVALAAAAASSAAASASSAVAASSTATAASGAPRVHRQRKAAKRKADDMASCTQAETAAVLHPEDYRGKLGRMRLKYKWTDGCGVQYVQRQSALGTASFYADTGVLCEHIVFPPHCFKYIHDAAGKVFVDSAKKAVLGREWTISNVNEHYDYNAAFMAKPRNEKFNFDFSFQCAAPHVARAAFCAPVSPMTA